MSLYRKLVWGMSLRCYEAQKSFCELRNLGIEITGRCNLRCRHCYMESRTQSLPEELSAREWIEFFSELKKDFGNKIIIQITGGEPLSKEGIFEILSCLKQSGFRVSIATNGTLLDDKRIIELKKYISSISVSLDGSRESHNYLRGAEVFDLVLRNIRKAQAAEIKNIVIKTTVYRRNFREIEKFYEFLEKEGIRTWHLFAMEPRGRGEMHQEEILSFADYEKLCAFIDNIRADKKRKMRVVFEEQSGSLMGGKTLDCRRYRLCRAGISSCAILSNGNVVECVQGNREDVQGNIRKKGFKDIWEKKFTANRSPDYRSCRKHHFDNNE